MIFVVASLFMAVAFAAVIIAAWNLSLAPFKYRGSLRPNLLLNIGPVIFLDGKRSPFFFAPYWGVLPSFLFEHGYRAVRPALPWLSSQARKKKVFSFLRRLQESDCVVVLSRESFTEFENILKLHRDRILQVIVTEDMLNSRSLGQSSDLGIMDRIIWSLHLATTGGETLPPAIGLGQATSNPDGLGEKLLSTLQFLAEENFAQKVYALEEELAARSGQSSQSGRRTEPGPSLV